MVAFRRLSEKFGAGDKCPVPGCKGTLEFFNGDKGHNSHIQCSEHPAHHSRPATAEEIAEHGADSVEVVLEPLYENTG